MITPTEHSDEVTELPHRRSDWYLGAVARAIRTGAAGLSRYVARRLGWETPVGELLKG
ncbi:hypothetical protein [Rhizobium sp. 007]|uniref:hypothetical protein n=1 Tax=Rhizobium sp. 007 TaxID=2785056 RepID=UPI00188F048C|nr:hypothetical protein [Rhizobium sp. 007]QPB24362.1 hypothetical protein ISN39_32965 [Rhizobium sp. 007]